MQIGDLVQSKQDGRLGVVIDSKPTVDGLFSDHMRHVVNCYPNVYYVLFPHIGRIGPFHCTELRLQQQIVRS